MIVRESSWPWNPTPLIKDFLYDYIAILPSFLVPELLDPTLVYINGLELLC